MKITINGKEEYFEAVDATLSALLAHKGVKNPEMVTVQVNGRFIDKEKLYSTRLIPDDEVEFLYFMGGGQHF